MPSTAKRSGNPRKRAAAAAAPDQAVDSNGPTTKHGQKVWGRSASGGEHTEELQVPSGETCLCRRPGVEGLLSAGVLHNIDSLTGLVDSKHLRRVKGQEEIDVQSLMADEKTIMNLLETVDRVVAYCVVEPSVKRTPNDPTNRKEGQIYCDMIELDDKMFIFQFACGGTRDLERFREQSETVTRGVGDEQAVQEITS